MTEDEGILCHRASNEYWEKLSKLIGETLSQVPENVRDDLMMQLQDRSSVYGSDYKKYIT